MSLDGQVDWKRKCTGWALAMIGVANAPAVPATVAAFLRKRRRCDAGVEFMRVSCRINEFEWRICVRTRLTVDRPQHSGN
jgi:hypothetical protein